MAERISEIMNSAGEEAGEGSPAERSLDELCAATLKRRGRRGRPKGTGRKYPERCAPKTFRNFSPLSRLLLIEIGWTDDELRKQTEAEIVEEALVRMARSLSNRNPRLAQRLAKSGR
jgi:hypothetical protein